MIDFLTLATCAVAQYGSRRRIRYYLVSPLHPRCSRAPFLINIDLPSSDLDILCCFDDAASFYNTVQKIRKIYDSSHDTLRRGHGCSKFYCDRFFDRDFRPARTGYTTSRHRHMYSSMSSYKRRAKLFDDKLSLKQEGYKTERAFAKLPTLKGEPYRALLDYGATKVVIEITFADSFLFYLPNWNESIKKSDTFVNHTLKDNII